MLITILDVIDNFFATSDDPNLLTTRGRTLFEFGEEVRKFAEYYEPPRPQENQHPTYLGGWPSANFWSGTNGRMILSSLLYSGQVLVKDPISDWFSEEQYLLQKPLASRTGYKRLDGSPNVIETRQFLSETIPALQQMRPLIEAGIIVLIPSQKYVYSLRNSIAKLKQEVFGRITEDLIEVIKRFEPYDLPISDSTRGLFVFAGGNQEQQIARAVERSVSYFAEEYCLASAFGFDYAAMFPYEQFLCKEGLEKSLLVSPSDRVLHAVLNSRLPLYQGLNPKVISQIRDDSSFADFRSQLYDIYRDIPQTTDSREIDKYIKEAEEAKLKPTILRAEAEVKSGAISRLGVGIVNKGFRIMSSILIRLASDSLANPTVVAAEEIAQETSSTLIDSLFGRRSKLGPISIWKKLYSHQIRIEDEIKVMTRGEMKKSGHFWGIPQKPSMSVTISNGLYIADSAPKFEFSAKHDNPELECYCGSKRKFKDCCEGLETLGKDR